jgi:hypothetical protein
LAAKDGGIFEPFNLVSCYAHWWGTKIEWDITIKSLRKSAEAGLDLAKQSLDALKDIH